MGEPFSVALDGMMSRPNEDGAIMDKFVANLALVVQAEMEKMLEHEGETRPKEIGPAGGEVVLLSLRWMVEKW